LDNLFGRAIVVANVEVPPRAAPAERLRLYDAAEARLEEMVGRLRQRHELSPLALRNGLPPVATESRYPRAAFERDVARVLEYVAAGDTFQTAISAPSIPLRISSTSRSTTSPWSAARPKCWSGWREVR
jgi:anthranilate/para-aminobenzoate synthase component I